jgi:hypothetical protein
MIQVGGEQYLIVKKEWIDGLIRNAKRVEAASKLEKYYEFAGLIGYISSADTLESVSNMVARTYEREHNH